MSFLLVSLLFGQGERGTFNGTVQDPSGAIVPMASVRVLNVGTQIETSALTTTAGVYRMPYLPPGTYNFVVNAPGFKTTVRASVGLSVAQTLTVDFTLEVGNATEQITVTSDAPLLETGTAEIGSYVSKKEFDTWPITVGDGRRQIQQFIFTSLPGTVGSTFQGSINGGQFYSHEILIDGMPLGRMDLQGGSNNEFSPSAEAISEFKLQTGTVSAQYSGGQTAVANFVTKSGTNELHGSAYYYAQNDALRANGYNNNAAGIARQPFKQHNYGGSLGGPVFLPKLYDGRSRTFWYVNWERTQLKDYRSTAFSTLPTTAFKQGNFAQLLDPAFTGDARSGTNVGTDALGRPVIFGQLYDPNTSRQVGGVWVRDPFQGNVIPRNRWSNVSGNILSTYGITDPSFNQMLRNIPNLGACCPVFDEKMLTAKGDHNFNENHRVSLTFNRNFRQRNNSPGGRWGDPPGQPTGVYQLQDTPGTLGRFSYDTVIAPTVLNHFAVGYNRFGNLNQSVFVDQDMPQSVGFQNLPGTHFPALTFSGLPFQGGGIGAGGRLGSTNAGGSFNGSTIIANDLTVVRGRHNFKMGFEHRRYYINDQGRGNTSGTFNFSPNQTAMPGFINQTGHSFASFLTGNAAATNRSVVASFFGSRWRSAGFYLQDDFKATRKLTFNLGFRWEIIGGLEEVAGRMAQFNPTKANPGAGGRPGALDFADELGVKTFMNTNWRQLSPKFGFAYEVSNRMVLRGGYGINNMPPTNNGFGGPSRIGYNGAIQVNSANTSIRFAEDTLFNIDNPYPSFQAVLPNRDPSLANGQGTTFVGENHNKLPYTQNWNLGMQFALPSNSVLEVNYVGNKGTNLPIPGFDNLNALPTSLLSLGDSLTRPWTAASGVPQPFPGFSGTLVQALRPFPQYTGISQPYPYFGNSSYHALQAQLTRHFRDGFSYLLAYTWSKSIGYGSDSAIDGQTPVDIFNRGLDRTITGFHIPHFFKGTWIYELPMGPDKLIPLRGIANTLFGGWQLTGVHQIRSGDALSIQAAGVQSPLGAVYPDLVPGVPIVVNSDAAISFRGFAGGTPYLNRAAFDNPPVHPGGQNVVTRPGTLGPILPNIRGPRVWTEDVGIQKIFRFTETRSFELRGTFLNPLNRSGRGNPITNLGDPNFGQITGARFGGRNVELAARVTF
ncbi:MAG: carboxypeptidase regulatory-like domain-containing protein [Bryobacterales bacterium]|nr:carboxypeptidase regulatory-like domain-containing protein [Bryobacterales bacterium]